MNPHREMNSAHATAFAFLGAAMALAPVLAPELFSSSSTRLLWLQVMGCSNASIGIGWHTLDFIRANLVLLEQSRGYIAQKTTTAQPSAAMSYWAYWAEQREAQ